MGYFDSMFEVLQGIVKWFEVYWRVVKAENVQSEVARGVQQGRRAWTTRENAKEGEQKSPRRVESYTVI